MYYEETEVDGVLCYRTSPNGPWIPFTKNELLVMIKDLKEKNSNNRYRKRTIIKSKVKEIVYDFLKKDNINNICDKIFNSGCIDIDSVNEKDYNLPKKIVCVISQELNDAYSPINEDDLTEINNMYRMM